MKIRILLTSLFAVALAHASHAQTAEYWISQGRAALAATNVTTANVYFSNAIVASPNHQTGNVFYAVTRLLSWPSQPAGSNFLNRLGVPKAGRDIYNWTALPPHDTNGVPDAPAGVNAAEFPAMLRTNILNELIGAEANLAKVTDPAFVLSLTSNETRCLDVTVDYGDIKLLRSMLLGGEYGCYAAYEWNLDALLAPLHSLYTNDQLSVERVFTDHPALLTFATTNDLAAARAALLTGVNRYFEASQFIRNRPTNIVRLFTYDPKKADDEANFRQTLIDLTNSFTHPVALAVATNYTVFLGSQFTGTHPLRPFLPVIRGNGFGLGTLPDPTFAGLIYSAIPGIVEESVEEFLAQSLFPIPTIGPELTRAGLQFHFPMNTLKYRGYAVEVSSNLRDWVTGYAFFSFTNGYIFADADAYAYPRRFYRMVDRTEDMPAPANDNFANRIPLTGLGITAFGYNSSATTEPGEPGDAGNTVWWSWTAPASGLVAITTDGSIGWHYVQVFTGNSTNSLTVITNLSGGSHSSRFDFYAVAGTTYQIRVGGDPGGIKLVITAPPMLLVTSPLNFSSFPRPTNLAISAWAADMDGTITNISIMGDWEPLASTTGSWLSTVWSNLSVGVHWIQVEASDNLGMTTWSNLTVYVRPPNDNFASRIAITGSSATVTGTNSGASKETGEPNHAGYTGGASIWWSWTSPFSGYVTMSVVMSNEWGATGYPLVAAYTGASVSALSLVASNAAPVYRVGAQMSFYATAGVQYQIAVDDMWGSGGIVSLRLIPTQAPTVSITWPPNNSTFSAPTNFTVTATAHDNDGTIAKVEFYSYSSYLGEDTTAPYSCYFSSPVGGSYTLLARATDSMGASTWSAPVYISIQPPPFSVWITSPTNGQVFTAPVNIPITAGVYDPGASVTQVRFGADTIIGSDATSPYSIIWSNVAPGSYYIGAEAEDTMRRTVFSDGVEILVNYPNTVLTSGVPATNLSGRIGSEVYYRITVPPGATSLQISTSGGTGDCDLYVAYGRQPALWDYDYRPYLYGNNETVTVSNPQAGEWHIMLDGYSAYSGVTLGAWVY